MITKPPIINPPHDELFRASMEVPIIAAQFLGRYLPKNVKDIIDIKSLKLEKESFVDEGLKNSIGDVLFSVKTNDGDAYIYTNSKSIDYK